MKPSHPGTLIVIGTAPVWLVPVGLLLYAVGGAAGVAVVLILGMAAMSCSLHLVLRYLGWFEVESDAGKSPGDPPSSNAHQPSDRFHAES